jgi:hypothetical protein
MRTAIGGLQVGQLMGLADSFPQAPMWDAQVREGYDKYARQRKEHQSKAAKGR